MIQFCIILWMFISSLLMNFLKPKTKTLKTTFILFVFKIVLACSSSSLKTISGTNIFGTIARDEAELYLLRDIIIHLILGGEQS